MRRIYMFFLSFVCLVNIGWMWKEDPAVKQNMEKGYEAWQVGNRTEAMEYYKEALTLEPKQLDALNSLGVIYEELDMPQQAEEKYLSVIKLNDQFLPAYSNLGFLYWNQGNLPKAAYYFKKRVELGNPKDLWTMKAQKALKMIESQNTDRQSEINQAMNEISG